MKLLVTLAAVMMVTGSVVAQRCGCNKPNNVNKPRPAAPAPAQRPTVVTPRQCAQAKPCAQRPVAR